jgi:hypothetical protein
LQLMALITVGDETADDMVLEIAADRITGALSGVLDVEKVQVGLLMSMDDALADIKAHIEAKGLGALPGDEHYVEPS